MNNLESKQTISEELHRNWGWLLAMGIILDIVFQQVLYHAVHPGAALVVGPLLICLPYALSRALTNRLARWLGKRELQRQQEGIEHENVAQASRHL